MSKHVLLKNLVVGQKYILRSDAWRDGVKNVKLVMKYIKPVKDDGDVFRFRIDKRSSNWKTDEIPTHIEVSYVGRAPEPLYSE